MSNQISHLLAEDQDLILEGKPAKYSIGGFFDLDTLSHVESTATGERFMKYSYEHLQTTLLKLEIKADDARYFYNVARGVIT